MGVCCSLCVVACCVLLFCLSDVFVVAVVGCCCLLLYVVDEWCSSCDARCLQMFGVCWCVGVVRRWWLSVVGRCLSCVVVGCTLVVVCCYVVMLSAVAVYGCLLLSGVVD